MRSTDLTKLINLNDDDATVAEIFDKALKICLTYGSENEELRKTGKPFTQKWLAQSVGLKHANVIHMLKTGTVKIPLDKAGKLGELLGLNGQDFWLKCFKEYMPSAYDEFVRLYKQPVLDSQEIAFIESARANGVRLDQQVFEEKFSK